MDQVSRFYSRPGGLVAAISSALDTAGLNRATLRPADLAPVDEFHIRGRAAALEVTLVGYFVGQVVTADLAEQGVPED